MIAKNWTVAVCAVVILSACASAGSTTSGTTIVNARVIDGSGGPERNVSVRLVGERIAKVGTFDPLPGDKIVDAEGLVLAPGFIDPHSHHDDRLFEMTDALAAVSQGITTIVAGQDGDHNYPLIDFFSGLEATPATINVASFAGHGRLRAQVMGEDYQRHATPTEIAAMGRLLDSEMKAGALGLSTGLEYDPGSFSTSGEVLDLAKVTASLNGRYISHIRSEDQYFWEAIDEIINIGREARLPVQVTHIKLAMTSWWGQSDKLLAKLNAARGAGVDITADIYPYRAWNTEFGWLTTLFPDRTPNRRDVAEYILSDMLSPEGILIPRFLPEPAYDGMTVAQIAKLRDSDPATTLMDLLQAEIDYDGDKGASSLLGFAMDEPDIEAIMAWPHTVIGSDGELAGPHPRGFGTFARVLGHYIRERNVVSLEEGIRKMTSLTAKQVGIEERGSIQVDHFADLVLFDPEIVVDRATTEKPHLKSVGIAKVWVNGQLVYADGETTGNRPGKPIRKAQ